MGTYWVAIGRRIPDASPRRFHGSPSGLSRHSRFTLLLVLRGGSLGNSPPASLHRTRHRRGQISRPPPTKRKSYELGGANVDARARTSGRTCRNTRRSGKLL